MSSTYLGGLNLHDCVSIEVTSQPQANCSVTKLKVISKTDTEDVNVHTEIILFGEKDKPVITSINGKRVRERSI
tara:strand:- start:48 stop:269 length:222 start_codon:yes stop_codon:yes gene_type:complete